MPQTREELWEIYVNSPAQDQFSFAEFLQRRGEQELADQEIKDYPKLKKGGLVTKGYKKGGSVSKKKKGGKARGCGVAQKGTRKAKLY